MDNKKTFKAKKANEYGDQGYELYKRGSFYGQIFPESTDELKHILAILNEYYERSHELSGRQL